MPVTQHEPDLDAAFSDYEQDDPGDVAWVDRYSGGDQVLVQGPMYFSDDENAPRPYVHDSPRAYENAFAEPRAYDHAYNLAEAGNEDFTRSAWYEARFKLIHEGGDPATGTTVLQAAFMHVEAVHRGASIAQVQPRSCL